MGPPSERQIEANRRNATKSTGPRTAEGKARSRRNGLRHGLAAAALVPDAEADAYRSELTRWDRDLGPENAAEDHLVRRMAVGSVVLARLDEARERSRADAAREAARRWEARKRHAARRKGQDLAGDPFGVVSDLEATAFGCEWLIGQWERLEAPLRLGNPWDRRTLARAQNLLGYPEGVPEADAEPEARRLWHLAGAAAPRAVPRLPRLPGEEGLPTDPAAARALLRGAIAEQVDRLAALHDASWRQSEGPELEAVAARAAAADGTPGGQLVHRYARDADRSASSALRLYLTLRERRQRHLLAIAKEAEGCAGVLRAPVGDGWWREVDSAPAPPGFARLGAIVGPDAGPVPSSPATAGVAAPPATAGVVAPPEASDPPARIPSPPPADPVAGPGDPAPGASPSASAPTPVDAPVPSPVPAASIDPPPTAAPPAPTEAAGPADAPAPAAPIDRRPVHRPIRTRPILPGAPRRSEPISPPGPSGAPCGNPNSANDLRDDPADRRPEGPRRTGPGPSPAPPAPAPDNRPPRVVPRGPDRPAG